MSALNEEQKKAVAAWFAAGASLDEIQKRIKAELGVHLTYLDVRLLVAELPQPTPPEAERERPVAPEPEQADVLDEPYADDADVPPAADGPAADAEAPGTEAPPAAVAVDMSPIAIPGTIASGTVVFSDGKSGKWYLDQMGQMGLSGFEPGYRPTPADARAFQQRLVELLRAKGLM